MSNFNGERFFYRSPFLLVILSLTLVTCASGHIHQPAFSIIDAHEHIQSRNEAAKLLASMDRHGIASTVLVASPQELFFEAEGDEFFLQPDINSDELLAINRAYPGRFYAFATFSPDDADALEKLKRFIDDGGTGLKLYNGHVAYHDRLGVPLNAPQLMPLYEYCERNRIPIVFHANARFYWDELKAVLDAYPKLIVNLPHYCMALINIERMSEIFDRYPNVYSDISLGHYEFAYPALEWVSKRIDQYRAFITKYSDRFLFGTDMVLTSNPAEDETYIGDMITAYRRYLENETYTNILIDYYTEDFGTGQEQRIFKGLHLDHETLRKIYEINPRHFLGIGKESLTANSRE